MAKAAQNHIHVVGGGIAGLAAAIALSKSGKKVTLYERAKKFEEVGAGLQLGPNAVAALQAIDAWDAVAPITYAPPAIRIHNGANAKLLKEISLGADFERRFGQPYRVAHRADLHAALLSVAKKRKVEIKMGKAVDATALAGEVIAADGVRSETRVKLFPGSEADMTLDYIYRALVPLPDQPGMDCVNLWLYPDGHLVHYPVGKKPQLNLVVVTQGKGPEEEFETASDALQDLIAMPKNWQEWTAAFVPEIPAWSKDNIRLIGDAAHGTLPFLAQGAAMALEDAALLMKDDAAAWAARQARCQKLHEETLKTGRIYHLAGFRAFVRDQVIMRQSTQDFLGRLAWIYAP